MQAGIDDNGEILDGGWDVPIYSPTVEPVYSSPAGEPVFQAPTVEPVFQAPTVEPVFQAPTVEPVYNVPLANPVGVDAETGFEPVAMLPTYAAVDPEPVNDYALDPYAAGTPTAEPVYSEPIPIVDLTQAIQPAVMPLDYSEPLPPVGIEPVEIFQKSTTRGQDHNDALRDVYTTPIVDVVSGEDPMLPPLSNGNCECIAYPCNCDGQSVEPAPVTWLDVVSNEPPPVVTITDVQATGTTPTTQTTTQTTGTTDTPTTTGGTTQTPTGTSGDGDAADGETMKILGLPWYYVAGAGVLALFLFSDDGRK